MKKKFTRFVALFAAGLMLTAGLAGCAPGAGPAAGSGAVAPAEFTPQLDTDAAVELKVSGFFGNFEALDQVLNNFNAYYPNVTLNYE